MLGYKGSAGVSPGGVFDSHGRAHAAEAARAGAVFGREHLEVVGGHPRLQGRSVVVLSAPQRSVAALSAPQRKVDRLLQLRALERVGARRGPEDARLLVDLIGQVEARGWGCLCGWGGGLGWWIWLLGLRSLGLTVGGAGAVELWLGLGPWLGLL